MEYAGVAHDKDVPETGHGTKSQTKTVSMYPVTINLKRHVARRNGVRTDITHNSKGSRVTMTYDGNDNLLGMTDEPLEIREERDPVTKERRYFTQDFEKSADELQAGLVPDPPIDIGGRLHLDLYDTPGLSDSDGLRTKIEELKKKGFTQKDAEEAASQSTRNLVDEKHRLNIIKAINKIGHLHAVCFVIQNGKNFGPELKKLKELFDMLKRISLDLNYYIIHTRVTSRTMFEARTLNRISKSEEFFGITAKHFFVNNLPDRDSPLSGYFADRVLSDLFFELLQTKETKVSGAQFRKTDRSIDQALHSSLSIFLSSLESDERRVKKELHQFEFTKRTHTTKSSFYINQIGELEKELGSLNTEDRVQLGDSLWNSASGGFFTRDTVNYYTATDFPIRHVEYDPTSIDEAVGYWTVNNWNGTTKFEASLEARRLCHVSRKVTLYGYKKDVQEEQITSLRNRIKDLKDLRDRELKSISELNSEIYKCNQGLRNLNGKMKTAQEEIRDYLKPDIIEMDRLIEFGHYLLTNDIYCTALGYELKTIIPCSLLQPNYKIDKAAVKRELRALTRKHEMMEAVAEKTVKFLECDCDRKSAILKKLTETKILLADQLQKIKIQTTEIEKSRLELHSLVNMDAGSSYLPETAHFLQKSQQKLERKTQSTMKSWENLISEEEKRFTPALRKVQDEIVRVSSSIEEVGLHIEKWSETSSFHRASVKAIESTLRIIDQNSYTLGEYTILRQGIERVQREPAAPHPFIQLYRSIAYGIQCKNNVLAEREEINRVSKVSSTSNSVIEMPDALDLDIWNY
ncbi:hypothetical protein ABW20_dc0105738 [Dactylellina cionopaga]|nr:hypothetical protein ABW20_dc0105738 [Dactylellina cionopaga]